MSSLKIPPLIVGILGVALAWSQTALCLSTGTTLAKEPSRSSARDWKRLPAILQLDPVATIAAIGDVHGDYERLAQLLKGANLIAEAPDDPKDVTWTGGQTVLICTGDIIDKGKHSLEVIECFRTLQLKATANGGQVIVTMGNHEAEFLADPNDDNKAERFLAELTREHLDPTEVAAGEDPLGIGAFLRSLPFAVQTGDWFFAHACNSRGMHLTTLDRELRDSVDSKGFAAKILLGKSGLLESRLKPMPWWEREGDSASDSESRLRGYADALGVKHFVMGHQPGKARFSDGTKRKAGDMIQKFDGLIFLIDVGMSSAIDYSNGAILWIARSDTGDTAKLVSADGSTKRLWPD